MEGNTLQMLVNEISTLVDEMCCSRENGCCSSVDTCALSLKNKIANWLAHFQQAEAQLTEKALFLQSAWVEAHARNLQADSGSSFVIPAAENEDSLERLVYLEKGNLFWLVLKQHLGMVAYSVWTQLILLP